MSRRSRPPTGRRRDRGRGTRRDEARRALGQNFIPDQRFAGELVGRLELDPGELVVELGAGRGDLTRQLLARGARVVAVEADPHWARQLSERLGTESRLEVVRGDMLRFRLPADPHRVFGNIPFNRTTAVMRRLFTAPGGALRRADLIVQREVALKRTRAVPRNVNSLVWSAGFDFELLCPIPASRFRPVPKVDAALLAARRREPPLLPPGDLRAFEALVRVALSDRRPLRTVLRGIFTREQVRRLARDVPVAAHELGADLDVERWVRIFGEMKERVPPESWPRGASRSGRR